jgi:hypothetical protein
MFCISMPGKHTFNSQHYKSNQFIFFDPVTTTGGKIYYDLVRIGSISVHTLFNEES